jgi:hypothetical protein
MFLNGAKIADRDYAQGQGPGFKVTKCTNLADNSNLPTPNASYHLIDGGKTGLFERSPDGTGALIQNRWSEDDGDHYFTWVQSSGWEYVIPKSGPPTRIVYTSLSTGPGAGGATKPTSPATARCEMTPAGS